LSRAVYLIFPVDNVGGSIPAKFIADPNTPCPHCKSLVPHERKNHDPQSFTYSAYGLAHISRESCRLVANSATTGDLKHLRSAIRGVNMLAIQACSAFSLKPS
jgi:hypothetical protein